MNDWDSKICIPACCFHLCSYVVCLRKHRTTHHKGALLIALSMNLTICCLQLWQCFLKYHELNPAVQGEQEMPATRNSQHTIYTYTLTLACVLTMSRLYTVS